MYFSNLLPIVALACGSRAALSAPQVVSKVNQLTSDTRQTANTAKSISNYNFFSTVPQMIHGMRSLTDEADEITVNLPDLSGVASKPRKMEEFEKAQTWMSDILGIAVDPREDSDSRKQGRWHVGGGATRAGKAQKAAASPWDESDQKAACDATVDYLVEHAELLQTIINKHGILAATPFIGPVGSILRPMEDEVDELAFGVIQLTPVCATTTKEQKAKLDKVFEQALSTYG